MRNIFLKPFASLAAATLLAACGTGHLEALDVAAASGVAKGYPGVAAAVSFGGATPVFAAAGLADIEANRPLAATDCFHIGSITKTLTAVVALQLAEEGKIDLDETLVDALGADLVGRIPYADAIVVRQLIDHSSGVYATNNDLAYLNTIIGPNADPAGAWTPRQFVERAYEGVNEPIAPPGEGHHYSDTNYILLGLVAEKASGARLKDLVRRRIFDRLGMTHSFFLTDRLGKDNPAASRCVRGYMLLSDVIRNFIEISPIFRPVEGVTVDGLPLLDTTLAAERIDAAGGVLSTLPDLMKFGRALFHGDLLSAPSQEFLMSALQGVADQPVGTEKIWAMQAAKKRYGAIVYKEGDGPGGATAVLAFHPERDAVFAAFTNSFGHFDESDFLLDALFPASLGGAGLEAE